MRVIIEADAEGAAETAAEIIAETVRSNTQAVLGLATGGTPIRCYQRLIAKYQQGQLDFSNVRTFNLDEYIGLPLDHAEAYHQFMQRELFSRINLKAENCRLPNPNRDDLAQECQEYEQAIDQAGGIDLQLLGIGRDGHIGFNEPGSSLASRTRVKHLTSETIEDNARFFGDPSQVPRLAITMGVGSILKARRCLLLATGKSKAEAIRQTVEGAISASCPASALQLHPHVAVVIDAAAASLLDRRAYYEMAERAQRELAGGVN